MDKKALFRAKVNEKLQKKRIDSPLVRYANLCQLLKFLLMSYFFFGWVFLWLRM